MNSSPNGVPKPRMSEIGYLLDASAVLAVMFGEPGAELVAERAANSGISTVNLSEVVAKLHDRRVPPREIAHNLAVLDSKILPFDEAIALGAGALRPTTRQFGLSLGDRACLATARVHQLTVLTADRTWARIDLGIAIEIIR